MNTTRTNRSPRFAFLDHPLPIAFAHRGGGLEAEENTLPAFERAVALGYRYLETDVQTSRDGVAFIFHDPTLDRLTGQSGSCELLDWSDLKTIRTKGGAEIILLEDLLTAWPDIRINIDPKCDAAVEPLAEAIRRCGVVDRISVGSFNQKRVERVRQLVGSEICWSPSHGAVGRLWLTGWGLWRRRSPSFPCVQVPPHFRGIPLVTARFIATAHAQGVQVHVWTVDEEAEMDRLLDLGADGIMTDRPSLLKKVLERRNQWTGR